MAPDSASNFCSAPVLYLFPWYFFLFRTLFVIATIHFIRKTRFSVDNTYRAFMRWAPSYKIWYRKHCLVYLDEAPPPPPQKRCYVPGVAQCSGRLLWSYVSLLHYFRGFKEYALVASRNHCDKLEKSNDCMQITKILSNNKNSVYSSYLTRCNKKYKSIRNFSV